MIDMGGHMPMFTLEMNIFSFISSETPDMCVDTFQIGLVFLIQSI